MKTINQRQSICKTNYHLNIHLLYNAAAFLNPTNAIALFVIFLFQFQGYQERSGCRTSVSASPVSG